jgi:putative transcriptional regulator
VKENYVIYNRIKELRAEKNLTQEQLAELVDVTRLTIISMEKQKYEPSLGLAMRLTNVLGISIEELFWIKEGID